MKLRGPSMCDVIVMENCTIVLTMIDHQKEEGMFKFFESEEKALQWINETSKNQPYLKGCKNE
jgi:hypothetical protein